MWKPAGEQFQDVGISWFLTKYRGHFVANHYNFMRQGKFKEAIRIFQFNVEAYPQSSTVYDSLGEAYMNNGDQAAAIENYEKSIKLNPENTNAVEMLKKLRAQ